ncbi:MAG: hypothetical protein R3A44_09180 [Caldilineaceae bacterium]
MNYVRCIKNETLWVDDLAPTYDPLLVVGRVYKVAPALPNDGEQFLRVVDEEGEDYLYPRSYFEPYLPNGDDLQSSEAATVHLTPYLKNILRAEALSVNQSVSTLLRGWIEERLDLPEKSVKITA